jgi:hypothetical protein
MYDRRIFVRLSANALALSLTPEAAEQLKAGRGASMAAMSRALVSMRLATMGRFHTSLNRSGAIDSMSPRRAAWTSRLWRSLPA